MSSGLHICMEEETQHSLAKYMISTLQKS